MRHETQDITLAVDHAGNVIDGSIWILKVPEGDQIVVLQSLQSVGVADVAALSVGDRDLEVNVRDSPRPEGGSIDNFELNHLAYEFLLFVQQQSSGEEADL